MTSKQAAARRSWSNFGCMRGQASGLRGCEGEIGGLDNSSIWACSPLLFYDRKCTRLAYLKEHAYPPPSLVKRRTGTTPSSQSCSSATVTAESPAKTSKRSRAPMPAHTGRARTKEINVPITLAMGLENRKGWATMLKAYA